MTFFDDFIQKKYEELVEENVKSKIKELIDFELIQPVVIIANPKNKNLIMSLKKSGIEIAVLWESLIEEDKIYQVNDLYLREQIIKMNEEQENEKSN